MKFYNVIITGASGFVGQNLSQWLRKRDNIDVSTLSLRYNNWQEKLKKIPSVDGIIHLAGKAHDTSNTSEVDNYFKINRDLTNELFNTFLTSDISDFFYFSSVKAVADSVEGILKEDVEGNPQTLYGRSKLAAEEYLLNQSLPLGKRLFIIRPCMIHGPNNKGNLNLLYKVVKNGIPWPLAAFDNCRSFLSVDNLSYLIFEMLCREDLPSGIYNFADDDTLSTNDIVALIAKVLGKKRKLLKISRSLIKSIAKIGEILYLPLNRERLKKLTESYVVSNEKIKTALGINKLPLTATEGMEKTIQSFKKNG